MNLNPTHFKFHLWSKDKGNFVTNPIPAKDDNDAMNKLQDYGYYYTVVDDITPMVWESVVYQQSGGQSDIDWNNDCLISVHDATEYLNKAITATSFIKSNTTDNG